MWVIYDTDTGEELDRVEDFDQARIMVMSLNLSADYDHYTKRWED